MQKFLSSAAILACLLAGPAPGAERDNPLVDGETWAELKFDVVGDAEIADGSAVFVLDAPFRAEDAATVPVHIYQLDGVDAAITELALVIDENPAPVVAEFTFSDAMQPLDLETRVRVNQYSNVRAIATTAAGDLLMNGRFVRASGGCSAPAGKDPEAAMADIGKMRLRALDDLLQQATASETQQSTPTDGRRVAQIMIKHPNYSGLQRDQVTHLFIGAHFIDHLEVYQGDEILFTMDAGISISENPSFRFAYTDNGSPTIRVMATDTEGLVFEQVVQKNGDAS